MYSAQCTVLLGDPNLRILTTINMMIIIIMVMIVIFIIIRFIVANGETQFIMVRIISYIKCKSTRIDSSEIHNLELSAHTL